MHRGAFYNLGVAGSQTCTKEGRCALRTGSMCLKMMNGGGLARQLGRPERVPCSAHICRHFPHGLRRHGAPSVPKSRVLGLGDDGVAVA